MKRCLIEVVDFYYVVSKVFCVLVEGSEGLLESQFGIFGYLILLELYKELVRFFNVYILWLEDENF